MLWLFKKLFKNKCDWVVFAKAKTNVVIIFEVVQKSMWLNFLRKCKSQCWDFFQSCTKMNVIGLLSLRWKPMLWLFPKLFGDQCDWISFANTKANVEIIFQSCMEINVIGLLSLRQKLMLWSLQNRSKTKCVLVVFTNIKANVILLPKLFWEIW
jgi:hypothetical protein